MNQRFTRFLSILSFAVDVDPVPALSSTEALVADVTRRSSGDAFERTESRELDTALPSAVPTETQESGAAAGDVPESTEATASESIEQWRLTHPCQGMSLNWKEQG